MLCFMCPSVSGVGFGYIWTMRAHPYVVFHVSKCYFDIAVILFQLIFTVDLLSVFLFH